MATKKVDTAAPPSAMFIFLTNEKFPFFGLSVPSPLPSLAVFSFQGCEAENEKRGEKVFVGQLLIYTAVPPK